MVKLVILWWPTQTIPKIPGKRWTQIGAIDPSEREENSTPEKLK